MLASILRWTDPLVKNLRGSQRKTLAHLVSGLMRGGRAGVAAIGRAMPGGAYVKHKIKRVEMAAVSRPLLNWAAASGQRLVLATVWTDLPGTRRC